MKTPMSRLFLLLALAVSVTGCETLRKTPQVDLAPAVPVPVRQVAAPAAVAVPTGSLFQAASYRPAFEDVRARWPGDTVRVEIVERISASQRSSASIDRSAGVSGGVAAFPLLTAPLLDRFKVGADSSNNFQGKGGTESANKFEGSITATVVEVLPNGHLVLAGEKQIGVNQNVDVLRFSGTVDPRQIQPGNVVPSTQVANARIESRGRGAQGEALSIGWLGRFFLSVMPF
ncbi:MAG: flagellar basal body L-ring protein FlgH [Hydrogenophaga sp.]|nr:flagellar basal body L-ring protein FlgH [Hydrogenophaga sp.]